MPYLLWMSPRFCRTFAHPVLICCPVLPSFLVASSLLSSYPNMFNPLITVAVWRSILMKRRQQMIIMMRWALSVRRTIFSATKSPRRRRYLSSFHINPTTHTPNSSCTYRGSNCFIGDADAFTTAFGAYPHLLVFNNNTFVPASSSLHVAQFSKNLFWTWYLHTVSIAYTGISEFDPSSTEYQSVMLQSISAIVSGVRDLSIGLSNALLASHVSPPSNIFVKANILIQALPSDTSLWSNENPPTSCSTISRAFCRCA